MVQLDAAGRHWEHAATISQGGAVTVRKARVSAVEHRVALYRRLPRLWIGPAAVGIIFLLAISSAAAAEWSLLPSGLAFTASTRPSVSCGSKRACLSVSSTWNGSKRLPAAYFWNGKEWSDADPPFPSEASEASLQGVACVTAKRCIAVGKASTAPGKSGTLVEQTTNAEAGEWTVVHPPNPVEAEESNLSNISCASAKSCTAVGYYYTPTNDQKTLAEHWNGRKWSIEETPNPLGANESGLLGSSFSGVACPSTDSCTAVGTYHTKSLQELMFAEHWNGSEWTLQKVAEPPAEGEGELEAVSCPSVESCYAIGAVQTGSEVVAAAEHWNGSEWAFEVTPHVASSRLGSVSCTSAESCTAVGWRFDGGELTLAEHWDGSAWSLQETINPPESTSSGLEGVSCYTSARCIATGQAALGEEPSLLAERST
jgi:hypothetical protein